ncbi:zinc protease [Paenibacillus swuensis]|uniref:Zinc protease n=1 Tax=Paenibacillus swuensis TaxID=1178515 RepID=A0A172TKZ7_9BACL|nr:pitrilysin family protein [Paenibacillus swuensis]ANE47584.1 zinc protease [Paenibacillus swuensis]
MIKHKLNNGLRIVMEQIPSFRSVTFGIWVKTGSRNEIGSDNGISHFIEHMLFKGTERYTAQDIAEVFDGIGGNVNAFTSKEYTCYYAKVLDQHLPLAVDVLSDMFFHSQFDGEELEKEKNVILEEIAMYEDTPDDMVHDLITKASYGDHPLAAPILGTESLLQAMQSDDLRKYLKENYHLGNTVISIAGNIEEGAVLRLMEEKFGHFDIQGTESVLELPTFQGNLLYHEKATEQNHICLSFPGCSLSDPRIYGMILLNNTIGGGMSSRLFQEIREKRGLAYSVYSYHSSHIDSGLFTLYAGTAPKQTAEVLKITMEVMQDIARNGITDNELQKGKEQLKGSLILSLESTSSRMNRLGKNELMLGRHYTLDQIIERIDAVSMDDLRSLYGTIFGNPFAMAMVGQSDQVISNFRRDQLVL